MTKTLMDIVERLRNLETKLPTTSDNWLEARELQQEAAAEIERLRAENERLREALTPSVVGMKAADRATLTRLAEAIERLDSGSGDAAAIRRALGEKPHDDRNRPAPGESEKERD